MQNDNAVSTGLPVAGRSLHRWLVGIPVVLFILTLSLFAVYASEHDTDWLRWALLSNVVALVAGAITAAAGWSDFARIPQAHRARMTALLHGGLNGISLTLLAVNVAAHRDLLALAIDGDRAMPRADPTLAIALTAVAVGITAASGVLGYLVAHRHLVGLTADQLREHGQRKAVAEAEVSEVASR